MSTMNAVVETHIYRSTRHGGAGDEITTEVMDCALTLNQDATASQWVVSGTTLRADLFDRLFDYIRVTMRLNYDNNTTSDEVMLGLHRIKQTPKSHPRSGSTGSFQTEDLAAVASRKQLIAGQTYTVPAGTNPATLAEAVLVDELGFLPTQLAIPAIAKTTSAEVTYLPGDSWLKIVNDALQAVGYRTISMNKHGLLTTAGAQVLHEQSIAATYDDGNVIGTPEENHDDSRLKNLVTVRRITPGMDPISWTAMNEDPSSPLNVHGPLGQLPAPYIDEPQLADEDAARQRAESELSYGSSFYSTAEVSVVPDPAIDLFQVVQTNIRDARNGIQLDGVFAQRAVQFPLGVRIADSAQGMRASLNRVTPFVISGGAA